MSSSYISLKSQQQFMLSHLKDMFNGTFDEDTIETVLEQRLWNMDQALDDLMLMTEGCTSNISSEVSVLFHDNEVQQTVSSKSGEPNFEIQNIAEGNEIQSDNEDDIIVLNEEEFCLSAQSDAEDELGNNVETTEVPVETNKSSSGCSYAEVASQPVALFRDNQNTAEPSGAIYSGYTSYERIKRTRDSLERIRFFVREGYKMMVILRGLPGSGKSHLAQKIINMCDINSNYYSYVHSADNYFYLNKTGLYQFNSDKLSEAHRWNKINVLHVAREGLTPIIIDNTNIKLWEMQFYASVAVCCGYDVEIVEPDTHWAFSISDLAKKNVHSVSKDSIRCKMEHYQHGIGALHLLKACNLTYAPDNTPPQVGIKELSNLELLDFFDNIYNTLNCFPKQSKKKNKTKKLTKKEKKKLRKLEKETKRNASIIDEKTEIYEENTELSSDELMNSVLKSYISNNIKESDVDEKKTDNESNSHESVNCKKSSDIFETSSVCSSLSIANDENIREFVDSDTDVKRDELLIKKSLENLITFDDEKMATNKNDLDDTKNIDLKEKLCCRANETVLNQEIVLDEKSTDQFSNQLYDKLSKTSSRLKCFEMLHGTNDENGLTDEAENRKLCSSVSSNKTVTDNLLKSLKNHGLLSNNHKKNCMDNVSNDITDVGEDALTLNETLKVSSEEKIDIGDALKSNIGKFDREITSSENENLSEQNTSMEMLASDDRDPNTVVQNILNNSLKSVPTIDRTSDSYNHVADTPDDINYCSPGSLKLFSGDDFMKYSSDSISSCKRQLFETDINADSTDLSRSQELIEESENINSRSICGFNSFELYNNEDGVTSSKDNVNVKEKCCNSDYYSNMFKNNVSVIDHEVNSSSKLDKNLIKNINPVNEESAIKVCNIDSQLQTQETDLLQSLLNQDLSYINNLNDHHAVVNDECNQVVSSSKFCNRDVGNSDISTSLIRNVIENNLWGDESVSNVKSISTNDKNNHLLERKKRQVSDSENSDCSNFSSPEEHHIQDIHNSVNRFVNNDIKGDVTKKQNINQFPNNKDKNVSLDSNLVDHSPSSVACWNDTVVPEYSNLKEKTRVDCLDKVLNQSGRNNDSFNENLDVTEVNDEVSREKKLTNVTGNKKSCSTFQLLENKLKDNVDKSIEFTVEHNDLKQKSDCDPEIKCHEMNKIESNFWNQWIRDSWENGREQSMKKIIATCEPKPARTSKESPTKNINCDTLNLKLINDGAEKCNNKENVYSQKFKISNPNFVNEWQLGSSSFVENFSFHHNVNFNFDDSYKKPTNLSSNMLFKKSINQEDTESDYDKVKSTSVWNFNSSDLAELKAASTDRESNLLVNHPDNFSSSSKNDNLIEKTWNYVTEVKSSTNSIKDQLLKPKPHRQKSNGITSSPIFTNKIENELLSHNNKELTVNTEKEIDKWNSVSENSDLNWPSKDNHSASKWNYEDKYSDNHANFSSMFIPIEVLNFEKNKETMTNADDLTDMALERRIGSCREINEVNDINFTVGFPVTSTNHKSTMTEESAYTVKVKPLREDLINLFPSAMVDSILDLFEKCNGNMDWILEILLDDGFSPNEDQLEYLSSLQNVTEYEYPKIHNGNKVIKKRNKSSIVKNIRRNNSHLKDEAKDGSNGIKKAKRKKGNIVEENVKGTPLKCDVTEFDDENDDSEESVKLFLDSSTVNQLTEYFGNPTLYSLTAYQPVINIPVSLARQLHAYLIDSVIDQCEKNDDLINQLLNEEQVIADELLNAENHNQFTTTDVNELEKSLTDFLIESDVKISKDDKMEDADPAPKQSVCNEDSFAAKVALDLLFKSFPTLDRNFIRNTFKTKNYSYSKTKTVLREFGKEVDVNPTNNEKLSDINEDDNDWFDLVQNENLKFYEDDLSTVAARNDALKEVENFRKDAAFNFEQWQKYNGKLKNAMIAKKYSIATYYRDIMNVFKQKYEQCNAKAAALLFNLCLKNSYVIDLHFFKVSEALKALDVFIDYHISRLIASGRQKTPLYIITGRGKGSIDSVSHLQPAVKNRLKRRNIFFLTEMRNTGMVKCVVRKNCKFTNDL